MPGSDWSASCSTVYAAGSDDRRVIAAGLVCCALATPLAVDVSSRRGEYTVRVEATIDRPYAEVWMLLTDYDHLTRLSTAIQESRRVPVDDATLVVDTVTRSCRLFFCRTVHHRQVVVESPPDRIVATTLPEHSNLREGEAVWRVVADGAQTRIEYRMTMRPAFFVPPLIGPAMVRTALKEEAEALIAGLETTPVREE